ncbi:MAG: cyclic nucleotide-binding domain-containing protein [Pseudomonadota bacterium]
MKTAALADNVGDASNAAKFPDPIKVVKALRPISQLPNHALERLIDHIDKIDVADGRSIVDIIKDRTGVYYLIDGCLRVIQGDQIVGKLSSSDKDALNALDRRSQESTDLIADSPCVLAKITWRNLEDLLLEFAPAALNSTLEVKEILASTCSDWMVRLLQSDLLSGLAAQDIQTVMSGVELLQVRKDETIIKQGDDPDHFYIIEAGEYAVTRDVESSGRTIPLATLKAGEFFGEEALITGDKRGTSVTAKTDGTLLKVHGDTFTKAIVEPTLMRLTADETQEALSNGRVLIDVRETDLYEAGMVPDSINLVLKLLRINSNQLDKEARYITAANEPNAAALASFLLRVRGFDASCLDIPLENYAKKFNIELEASTENAAPQDTAQSTDPEPVFEIEVDESPVDIQDIDKLSSEHESRANAPAPKEDYAHTVIGVGLADLIDELHGDGGPSVEEIPEQQQSKAEEEAHLQEIHSQIGEGADFDPSLGETVNEVSKLKNASAAKKSAVQSDADIKAEIDRQVNEKVARITAKLRKEVSIELAKQKKAGLLSLKNQQEKLLRNYRTKRKELETNSQKLITLAHKISQQKAEVEAQRKTLAESQATLAEDNKPAEKEPLGDIC